MSNFHVLDAQRRALGLTIAQLSAAAGITAPTWRELCRGRGHLRSLTAILPVLSVNWGPTAGANAAQMGEALIVRRKALGLSQADLARGAGCSRPTVVAIERRMIGQVRHFTAMLAILGWKRVLQVEGDRRRPLIPRTNTPERDVVMTPPALAQEIVDRLPIPAGAHVLDPARGLGAFFDAVPLSCTKDWCELSEGRDFFDHWQRADWIITNPPWSVLRPFLQHAMTLADDIVLLAPLPNFTTRARLGDIHRAGFTIATLYLLAAPRSWPQSGFQLVAAHIRKGAPQPWSIVDLMSDHHLQAALEDQNAAPSSEAVASGSL